MSHLAEMCASLKETIASAEEATEKLDNLPPGTSAADYEAARKDKADWDEAEAAERAEYAEAVRAQTEWMHGVVQEVMKNAGYDNKNN